MVKFSRELEAQLIPEWKDAFVNYNQLKKHIKKIKRSLLHSPPPSDAGGGGGGGGGDDGPLFGFSIVDSLRNFTEGRRRHQDFSFSGDQDSEEEMEPVQSREEERGFFNTLETELEKVNNFYKAKEGEFCERGEVLSKQLQILIDLKRILDEHHRRRYQKCLPSSDSSTHSAAGDSILSRLSSHSFSDPTSEADEPVSDDTASPVSEEVIAALERNGISFVGSARSKAKKGMKPKAVTMRIDIPATTPGKTISAITSMVWEDLVNGARKGGGDADASGRDYINRKKIQCAEKMIRGAFVELYRGLGLLKTFSSLNMVAFTKILKKYDKESCLVSLVIQLLIN